MSHLKIYFYVQLLHFLLFSLSYSVNLENFNYNRVKRAEKITDFNDLGFIEDDINEEIIQDAFLKAPQLVHKYGYPSETHHTVTSDGYVLEMHRIVKRGGIPVLMMHGLLDSSSTWVMMGLNKGFGYILHDLGYDVWMGNVRGNRYSRNHTSLSPEGKEFWQFSWHEIGLYDIPEMIDYILLQTNFTKLHYIGHSQGSTVFWVMASLKPEYNEKILSIQALGPVAFVEHCRSPLVQLMTIFMNTIAIVSSIIGLNEFMPNNELLTLGSQVLCRDESFTQSICSNAIFLMSGFNQAQLNTTMLPVIIGHSPAGASAKQMIHFAQLKRSGEFRQYDYGFLKNYWKYGQFSPPDYDLSKITAKVAIHYSLNDYLAVPLDIERLRKALKNVVSCYEVPSQKFAHLDFVWGIDSRTLIYDKVINVMQRIETGEL